MLDVINFNTIHNPVKKTNQKPKILFDKAYVCILSFSNPSRHPFLLLLFREVV